MALRVVYFGTPAFAVPALEALVGDDRFDVRLVVTQPDRPSGRGRVVESSPVARTARMLGVPLYQPSTLRGAEARVPLAKVEADLFVVAAFGLIFGPSTLAMPRMGCVNLHASLLPRYRGASPILAAILSGDEETGVTLMRMEQGLDTGGIIASVREPISSGDTTESLTGRLAERAVELVRGSLMHFAEGGLVPRSQPALGASVTRLITKADGWLEWSRPATELERQVRAMWPWPRAWTTARGSLLQVHQADVVTIDGAEREPGSIVGNVVVCGTDALALRVVQPAGRKPTDGRDFFRGLREVDGLVLGGLGAPGNQPAIIGRGQD